MKKVFSVLALMLLASYTQAQTYTVALTSFNYTDSTISRYSVDGTDGGIVNVERRNGGGDGGACCVRVTVSKPVRIKWTFSTVKPAQYLAGMPDEKRELTVMVPKP